MGKILDIINDVGRNVTWMDRQADGAFINRGTQKASVQPANSAELIIEAGYGSADYQQVFAGFALKHKDRLVIDAVTWEVQPVQHWDMTHFVAIGDEYWTCMIRRMLA